MLYSGKITFMGIIEKIFGCIIAIISKLKSKKNSDDKNKDWSLLQKNDELPPSELMFEPNDDRAEEIDDNHLLQNIIKKKKNKPVELDEEEDGKLI